MKQFDISVRVDGYEYYTVTAETEEEAIQKIVNGDYVAVNCEVDWNGDFCVDSVEEIK